MSQFKLVPVEPTPEMSDFKNTGVHWQIAERIYASMLSVAPEPAQEPVAWMYWDRMAGEYDVRVGKDEPNVVGATPLYAAPATPTNLSDARDAQRLDALIAHDTWHLMGSDEKGWMILDNMDGLATVVRGCKTARDAIDAAIAALSAQGGASK